MATEYPIDQPQVNQSRTKKQEEDQAKAREMLKEGNMTWEDMQRRLGNL